MTCCLSASDQEANSGCKKFATNLLVGSLISVRYFFLDWHPVRLGVAAVSLSIPLFFCDLQYSAFIGIGGAFIGKAVRDILPLVKAAKAATPVAVYLTPVAKGVVGTVIFGYGMREAYKQAFIE
ncbi:MAG: hypothetical protein JSR80_08380 [Verrucomicrobia bacterium]|nr:hypothetical protein [Verrucomicrobiota bacterium]